MFGQCKNMEESTPKLLTKPSVLFRIHVVYTSSSCQDCKMNLQSTRNNVKDALNVLLGFFSCLLTVHGHGEAWRWPVEGQLPHASSESCDKPGAWLV